MEKVTHGRIIGIDVSRDWLDIHCLPDGLRHRIPNTDDGHIAASDLAHRQKAVVCFEATGGQEWRLWSCLEYTGVEARQVAPAQVKAFARSLGTRAKTDRIDAELIARFLIFRPDAGRVLPAEHLRLLRALTTKRAQVVEMRKRLLAQIRAHQKSGTEKLFDADRGTSRTRRLHRRRSCGTHRSRPGRYQLGKFQTPLLGRLHPAPTKRAIAGGRRALRHVLFQAALVASHHNPTFKTFANRLRKAGKPHKVIITAVARKLVIIANPLCKRQQEWDPNYV